MYVAKYKEPLKDKKTGNDIWWTATGTQFQIPYVFKTLFSGEEYSFEDFCETKSVAKGAIVIDMNEDLPQLTEAEQKEYNDILKLKDPTAAVSKDKIFKRYGYPFEEVADERLKELQAKEDASHNYIFVGRIGQFCPIIAGGSGGILYRNADDKYYALSGTKNYRWLESEVVRTLGKQDLIDRSYYDKLVDEAVRTIDEVGERCGYGGYKKLVGKEEDDFEWPPETPKY